MSTQHYEEYWKLTNAFTDYNGKGFIAVLKICVDFIQKYAQEVYSQAKYERLQKEIMAARPLNAVSIRKQINQLVKLGFIMPRLVSFAPESREYLQAKTNKKRRTLLSKIVYKNSSLNRSVDTDSDLYEINFLINTLVENGKLTKEDIAGLMLVDISVHPLGYLTADELEQYKDKAKKIAFLKRKYNQISHFCNLLSKLDDICFIKNELYFTEDAVQLFGDLEEIRTRKRDPYLHLIYKNQLKEESSSQYKKEQCMVERLPYPILIASHIKPFIESNDIEAYDPNNGLLLSQNIDGLFDRGYISFTDEGTIVLSKKLDKELRLKLAAYSVDITFLNADRKKYLHFHREYFKKKLQ